MKKQLSTFLFLVMLLPFRMQANGNEPARVKANMHATDATDEVIDLENHIMFQEKVYIHISDLNENPLVDGAYSREDLKNDNALRDLLRKSIHYLTIDSHYYYFIEVK